MCQIIMHVGELPLGRPPGISPEVSVSEQQGWPMTQVAYLPHISLQVLLLDV